MVCFTHPYDHGPSPLHIGRFNMNETEISVKQLRYKNQVVKAKGVAVACLLGVPSGIPLFHQRMLFLSAKDAV